MGTRLAQSAAHMRPSELSERVDVSTLVGHFTLGQSLPVEPPDWRRRELHGWKLLHEPSLPARDILDGSGSPIGWLLGHLIDTEKGTVVTGPVRAPIAPDTAHSRRDLETWLYAHGGRFAAVLLGSVAAIYPDAGASLPVMFDTELQCAASSPFLLTRANGHVPDSPLADALAVFDTGSHFPLGITPQARVNCLLPNHVLDLKAWEQSRIWPSAVPDVDDVPAAVERIAVTLERTMSAIAAYDIANVGLTAGGDTRTLLACSRGVLDRFRFFTVAVPDAYGSADMATARTVAKRFGLDYRVLPWREPTAADVDVFMYRTGCMVGEPRGRRAGPTYAQLGPAHPYISGLGSIVPYQGRRRGDDPTIRWTPEALLARFWLRPHPIVVQRAQWWLSALPAGLDGIDTLALFKLENVVGCWGGQITMAYPDACSVSLYPFAHRSIIDDVLRLPWRDGLVERLRENIIATRWPELLEFPIIHVPIGVRVRQRARAPLRLAKRGVRKALTVVRR
jgi:hypothetical protein